MALITFNTKSNPNIWFELTINHITLQKVAINLATTNVSNVDIDWGDGIIDFNMQSNATYLHTLVNNSNKIRIRCSRGLEDITTFNSPSLNITGSISQFSYLPNLRVLSLSAPNMTATSNEVPSNLTFLLTKSVITGSLLSFPNSLKHLQIDSSQAVLTGSINDLWQGLEYFSISRSKLSGNINTLPNTLEVFNLSGNKDFTITGSLDNLPLSITYFRFIGDNQFIGSINALPVDLTVLYITRGNNLISGDITNLNTIEELFIQGENSITGSINNLSNKFRNININGNNTISGSLNSSLNVLTSFNIQGANTISGSIEDCFVPFLTVIGNNTIGGNLGAIPYNTSRQTLQIGGNNSINYSNSKSYTGINSVSIVLYTSSNTFTPQQLDQLLIDLATANIKANVSISGPAAVRTSNSDNAVQTIENNNGRVLLFP